MVREICKDEKKLKKKSNKANIGDERIVYDLIDTLKAHRHECLGMAANMIGENKQIIAVYVGALIIAMINPRIIDKSEPYETYEGCLSLEGQRKAIRYKRIEVEFEDSHFNKTRHIFTGLTAQIIQHEINHLEGMLI
ncbi:MAG: peptide deformylase [Erysipelotrichaceae bacterium]|nr:peptide deformylase [Erysipelotrichaceae bacterium]